MHYVYWLVWMFWNKTWYLLKQHSTAGTLSTTQQRNTASTTSIQLISQFSMTNVVSAYPGCGPGAPDKEILIPHRFATLLRIISPSIGPNFPVQSRSRKRYGSDAGGQGKLSHISIGSPTEFLGSHCKQCCLSS